MTPSRRRFWLWVNVFCLAVALVCILVGVGLDSHPAVQDVLVVVGVVALAFGVGSAWVVALRVHRERNRD